MMPEGERPEAVIFAVQTDGLENASREFTRERVFEMLRHQEENYAWQFVFLAADQDAIAEGSKMGFAAASALDYDKSGGAVAAMYDVMFSKVTDVRRGQMPKVEFSRSDRSRTRRR